MPNKVFAWVDIMPKGIIVYHYNAFGDIVFDVFVHEKYKKDVKKLKKLLYYVDCRIAKVISLIDPKLVFVGSEDFCHIPEINESMKQLIKDLKKDGFVEVDITPLQVSLWTD